MSIELARQITGYYDVTGYGWVIDTDHLYDPSIDDKSEAGTMGPSRIDPLIVARLKNGEGTPFKMYDDDGELNYSGRIIVPADEEDGDLLFRPLEDFGTPNAGATEIHYENKIGEWQPL